MTTDKQLTANDLIYIELCKITHILERDSRRMPSDVSQIIENTAKLKLNK